MSTAVQFKASWGRSTWIITACTMGLLVGLAIMMMVLRPLDDQSPRWVAPLIAAAMLMVPALVAPFVPLNYELTDDHLIVRRYGPDIRIAWAEVASVEARDAAWWKTLGIRLFGDGGLFGFCGWFWTRDLKTIRVSATRLDTLVVVRLRNAHPLIVSPDDRDAFMAAVNAKIAAPIA